MGCTPGLSEGVIHYPSSGMGGVGIHSPCIAQYAMCSLTPLSKVPCSLVIFAMGRTSNLLRFPPLPFTHTQTHTLDTHTQDADAVEKLVVRLLPRLPLQRSVKVGDVVAFNSPLALGHQDLSQVRACVRACARATFREDSKKVQGRRASGPLGLCACICRV